MKSRWNLIEISGLPKQSGIYLVADDCSVMNEKFNTHPYMACFDKTTGDWCIKANELHVREAAIVYASNIIEKALAESSVSKKAQKEINDFMWSDEETELFLEFSDFSVDKPCYPYAWCEVPDILFDFQELDQCEFEDINASVVNQIAENVKTVICRSLVKKQNDSNAPWK